MNNLIIAGTIVLVCSLIILLLLSMWIGLIGLIVGIGLIIGGVCIKPKTKETEKDKENENN